MDLEWGDDGGGTRLRCRQRRPPSLRYRRPGRKDPAPTWQLLLCFRTSCHRCCRAVGSQHDRRDFQRDRLAAACRHGPRGHLADWAGCGACPRGRVVGGVHHCCCSVALFPRPPPQPPQSWAVGGCWSGVAVAELEQPTAAEFQVDTQERSVFHNKIYAVSLHFVPS